MSNQLSLSLENKKAKSDHHGMMKISFFKKQILKYYFSIDLYYLIWLYRCSNCVGNRFLAEWIITWRISFTSWNAIFTSCLISFSFSLSDAFGVKSGEWEIEHVQKVETNVDYDCCPNPFSTIQYTFTVRRMALYYFLYIILPLVAQVFLFFVIFHIPNDGGERTGFGVTILLSITVYLLVLSDQLPEKSDDRPMLGLCFIVIFYVLSIALVCAACIVKLVTKKTRPPKWLLQLSGASNKLCCLSKKSERDEHQKMLEMSYMNGKDGITQHNNGEEDEEEFNNKLWVLVCDFLDKFCFYFFLFIVILAPIIIVASLDKTMLGT